MSGPATIRAEDLRLVLAAAKLRRHTHGRTCALAALSTGGALLQVDCFSNPPTASWLQQARRFGASPVRITPLQRGHIARLFERVAQREGRTGVLATWGAGIRTLRAEPRHVLRGGTGAAA